MAEPDRDALVSDLRRELAATGELAVSREANRWLAEAEAIAEDLAESDLSASTVDDRVREIRRLLGEIEETDNPTADEHVARALELTERIMREG